MKVSHTDADAGSEKEFADRFRVLSDAGAGVIQVRTAEVTRALLAIRKEVLVSGATLHEWDVVSGMKEVLLKDLYSLSISGDGNPDIHAAFTAPSTVMADVGREQTQEYSYYLYVCPHYWLENNPGMAHLIRLYAHALPPTTLRVVLLTTDAPLPQDIADVVHSIAFSTPSHTELRNILSGVLSGIDDDTVIGLSQEDIDRICFAGAGLPAHAFETYVSLAIVRAVAEGERNGPITVDEVLAGVTAGKTEVVKQTDLLELFPTTDMKDVGGLDNLKAWIRKRTNCYSDEAREFGIEPPKGIVVVGIAGNGKSLIAKSVSREFGVPLLRLDFGKMFNSLVGSSEARMRSALRMIESMAPVCVLIDEIDKGLGGLNGGGGGDSGTSQRVLGTFLSWMQENTKPVFCVITCNSVMGLPPELTRKGRVDAIFGVGLPNATERKEILAIHLRKRGWDIKSFGRTDIQEVVDASAGYVGAEIESAVRDALIDAFYEKEEFSASHVVAALKKMIPMSVTYNTRVQELSLWLKANATPASIEAASVEEVDSQKRPSSRTRLRNRAQ